MTRSSYGPEWPLEANQRRLDITRGVTARLMKIQTVRDWEWVVLMDRRDELLEERREVFAAAAPRLRVILWAPESSEVTAAPWDKHGARAGLRDKVAATAYRHPGWLEATSPRDGVTLMTRLDDDDGLAPDALERMRRHGGALPAAVVLPSGVRVWDGWETRVVHDRNAMHTLAVGPGSNLTVYSYGHMSLGRFRVVKPDHRIGWLWVRHADTLSGWKKADAPISARTRHVFPVDWSVL